MASLIRFERREWTDGATKLAKAYEPPASLHEGLCELRRVYGDAWWQGEYAEMGAAEECESFKSGHAAFEGGRHGIPQHASACHGGGVRSLMSQFGSSFVLEWPSPNADEPLWNADACGPLVALLRQLHELVGGGSPTAPNGSSGPSGPCAWLSTWHPLRVGQHGSLHGGEVLVDARNMLWLLDFSETALHTPFVDAASLICTVLARSDLKSSEIESGRIL
jgi:hypothetical protein